MISKRILALASNVSKKDTVLDVGCDHGYLSIYLKENNLCKEVYASDISENALNFARKNFKKKGLDIETFVSDGFNDIPVFFDTAVLAGMGTNTILKILDNEKIPEKLVIGSNNDYPLLRKSLYKMGYKLVDEQAIFENNHCYLVMLYIKRKQKLNWKELKYGISNNEEYYAYLIKKNKSIMNKVPFRKRIVLWFDNLMLMGLIKRK